jgi:hypothetical protein
MFALTRGDLASSILDCAGGPASFTAEMRRAGKQVVSCDPIYAFPANQIARRIYETAPKILERAHRTSENFIWTEFDSPERMIRSRHDIMRLFLEDLPAGLAESRYRIAELPALPFRDRELDLALCSHFLFTYSNVLSLEFHTASIRELCRVAKQARIFPLFPQFGTERSPRVSSVTSQLASDGYQCDLERVPYEFQKGANEMLRVSRT